MTRAFDLACSMPWAITESHLRQILEIANRETFDVALAKALREDRAARPAALGIAAGRPLDNTRGVRVRDGVGIVEIAGPIMRRADFFSEISGATAVETLAGDIATALASPGVGAILLHIDSPGGEVTGIHELGELIYAARAQKPVWAYVEGLGASAAYWLASAADQIVADPTAALGSIGVVMTVRDPAKTKASEIEIVSSQSPRKRLDPTTEAGRASLQAVVDDLATVFVATVARNRGVSVETVLADFGAGGIFVGTTAVAAGLADRTATFESTLADLAAHVAGGAATTRPRPTATAPTQELTMSALSLRQMFAAVFGGAQDAGIVANEPVAAPDAPPAAPPEPPAPPAAEPAPAPEPVAEPTPPVEPVAEPTPAPDARAALDLPPTAATLAQLAAATARIAELEASASRAQLTALAQTFHGVTADHVTVLEALAAGSPARAAYERTQRAVTALAQQSGLFAVQGSDAPAPVQGNAWAQIEAAAVALVAAQPALSKEQAVTQVLASNKALYTAYRAEQAAA